MIDQALIEPCGRKFTISVLGFNRGVSCRILDGGFADDDTVSLRIRDQAGGGVKTHRPGAQQPSEIARGVVQFEPRAGIDQLGKGEGVAFREAETREGLNRLVNLRCGVLVDAVGRHALKQRFANRLNPLQTAFRPHRPSQHVRVFSAAVTHRHGHLHDLFLEHRDPQCALERVTQGRVGVGDGFFARFAAHKRVNGPTLNGPGANHRDLDGEVVEASRLQAGKQGHLRSRFHLEHSD